MSTMRAQTTIDFAIGISIFLAVLLFVFAFVPTILEPFSVGSAEHTVAVDRVADKLTQDALGSPSNPNVLDRHCTVNFTTSLDSGSPDADCRFSGTTLEERLGLRHDQQVNVTIVGNTTASIAGSNTLCWDASAKELQESGGGACTGDDVLLQAGNVPPSDNAATITARRIAYLWDQDVTVNVVMW